MTDGNPKNNIALLHPIMKVNQPKMNVPTIDPRLLTLASHEMSYLFKGPSTSGVSFDESSPTNGEKQPAIVPCPTRTQFAIENK